MDPVSGVASSGPSPARRSGTARKRLTIRNPPWMSGANRVMSGPYGSGISGGSARGVLVGCAAIGVAVMP
jgi:hypothetical protein